MPLRTLAVTICLPLAACLLAAQTQTARAANAQSNLRIVITSDLKASVTDQWTGLKRAMGKFDYFSATREHGSIPVDIKNGSFKLSFDTDSYLRSEGGLYYLVTPDFYNPDGGLDVHCTVEYPAGLRFMDAKPAPEKTSPGRLEWSLADCEHRFILARFEPAPGTGQPAPAPPRLNQSQPSGDNAPDGSLVDPSDLPPLQPGEQPQNPDAVLTEMRNVLRVAALEHSTDPQFIRVMDKVLAKFYFLFDKSGELPPRPTRAKPASAAAHAPAPASKAHPAGKANKAQAKPDKQTAPPQAQDLAATDAPRFRGIW